MHPTVLVTSYYDERATAAPLARLCDRAHVQRRRFASRPTEDQFAASLDGAAIAIVSDEPCTRRVLEASRELNLIACDGVGVDHIDLSAATDRGIVVVNAPVVHEATADFTMGLIIAVVRKLLVADRGVRSGAWFDRARYLSRNVCGATLGLIGFGRVAQAVAKRARAFDMDVLACSRRGDSASAERLGVTLLSLEDLLARCDIVSIHVPLNDSTRGLIGSAEIARMKAGAYLINTSRGDVVQEQALLDALVAGHLAGAGLDVFHDEPPRASHPFCNMDQVVLSPHVGSDTSDTFRRVFDCLVDDILRFLDHQEPRHVVNRAVLDRLVLKD